MVFIEFGPFFYLVLAILTIRLAYLFFSNRRQ